MRPAPWLALAAGSSRPVRLGRRADAGPEQAGRRGVAVDADQAVPRALRQRRRRGTTTRRHRVDPDLPGQRAVRRSLLRADPGGPTCWRSGPHLAPGADIGSSAGDPAIGKTLDPVFGGGACPSVSSADQGSGGATYRLRPRRAPDTRCSELPRSARTCASSQWPAGIPASPRRLALRRRPQQAELLGRDAPYLHPSNGTFAITVKNLVLRLPVHERPGSPRA
jgi:hypothetical protein